MEFLIVPNYYAPKSPNYINKYGCRKIHAISFNKCNFRCRFCGVQKLIQANSYYDYSYEEFEMKVAQLIPDGIGFKFTGGEPTLNNDLINCLKVVKRAGGVNLLDTNASNKEVIFEALDMSLIDILGISLKGVTEREAIITSGIKNSKLCWNNVLETIYSGAKRNVDVIVTYVVSSDIDLNELHKLVDLFGKHKNIYLKINNYQENKFNKDKKLNPYKSDILRESIRKLVDENENLHGRIIYVESSLGVRSSKGVEII